jgi:hypothetical protein
MRGYLAWLKAGAWLCCLCDIDVTFIARVQPFSETPLRWYARRAYHRSSRGKYFYGVLYGFSRSKTREITLKILDCTQKCQLYYGYIPDLVFKSESQSCRDPKNYTKGGFGVSNAVLFHIPPVARRNS